MFAFVAHFFHFRESELLEMSFERIKFWFDIGFSLKKRMSQIEEDE